MLVYQSRKKRKEKKRKETVEFFFLFFYLFEWVFISSVHMQYDCEIYCTIIHLIIAKWAFVMISKRKLFLQPDPHEPLFSTSDTVSCWLKHFTVQILFIQISFSLSLSRLLRIVFFLFDCLWLLKASVIFHLAYMIDTSFFYSKNHAIIFFSFHFFFCFVFFFFHGARFETRARIKCMNNIAPIIRL